MAFWVGFGRARDAHGRAAVIASEGGIAVAHRGGNAAAVILPVVSEGGAAALWPLRWLLAPGLGSALGVEGRTALRAAFKPAFGAAFLATRIRAVRAPIWPVLRWAVKALRPTRVRPRGTVATRGVVAARALGSVKRWAVAILRALGWAIAPGTLRVTVVKGATLVTWAALWRAAIVTALGGAITTTALRRPIAIGTLLWAIAITVIASVLIAAAITRAAVGAGGLAVADRDVGKWRVGLLLRAAGGVGVALFAHGAAGGSLDIAVRSHGEPVFSRIKEKAPSSRG